MTCDVKWNEASPGNLEDVALGDDAIRDTRKGVRERAGVQHKTYADETGHSDVWEHKPGECTILFVGLKANFPTPSTTTKGCVAIATDENNKFYYWNVDTWTDMGIVLTGGQAQTIGGVKTLSEIPVFTKGVVANNTYLQGRNAAGDGNVNLIKASAAGLPVLPDGAALATSAAPDADAKLANKKYVDETPHKGGVVQVVNTQTGAYASGNTLIPYDNTIPQNSEGDQYMTLAITPKSVANKLKIDVVAVVGTTNTGTRVCVALFQDSIASAIACGASIADIAWLLIIKFTHYMTAGTTSETTFKVRAGGNGGTLYFNGAQGAQQYGGVLASSITITELKV